MMKNTTLEEKVTKFRERLGKTQKLEKRKRERPIACPNCGSRNIIKKGFMKTNGGKIQRYGCKNCKHRFTKGETGFRKMRNKPEIVTIALDLYFKGLSYRKVADHLNQFYKLDVKHTAIYYWVQKYSELLNEFAGELVPEVSNKWQSDEMMVNVNGEYKWVWNLIDEEKRFLLAMVLTDVRTGEDAKKLFREAKKRTKRRPTKITTDKLQAYIDAYKKEFRTLSKPRTQHIRLKRGIGDGTTNLVERFHGTIRERDKVMRALETNETGENYLKGFQTYYNFLRPHMGLEGKTPAEVSGLYIEDENRWLSLIRLASEWNGGEDEDSSPEFEH